MDPAADSAVQSSDEGSHTDSNATGSKRKRRDTTGTVDHSNNDANADGSDKERHQCPHCDRSFGRVEHMKRHAASHSNERPFRCATCDKGFHRLDTMQRHELIHRDNSDASKPKGARACTECALAKVRCPGGMPCSRCQGKAAKCRYPDPRRSDVEPASPPESAMGHDVAHTAFDHPPPPATASMRTQSIGGVPFSPAVWTDGPTSPQQWLHQPVSSVDMPAPRSEFHERPTPARNLSFSSAAHRPNGLGSLTDADPYSNLRQAGFVTAANVDAVSISGSSTRNWLDTLLAPQSIDGRESNTPESNSHRATSISETYLDGDGARLPKIGIRRRYNLRPSLTIPAPGPVLTSDPVIAYSFPSRFCHPILESTPLERQLIGEATYNQIRTNFERTCGPQSSFMPCYESPEYPTWEQMQRFIQIYLDEYQPLVPMLHLPTLNLYSSHWLLSLALASMGCHFADMPEAEFCALALNEHLRRAISDVTESSEDAIDPVLFAQVKLLNCIGMVYCGDKRMERFGWRHHSDVVKFCRTHWINEDEVGLPVDAHLYSEVEVEWRQWRDIESRRRTGYAIWMFDCMWTYGYQERNLLSLEDAKVPVPCQEVLWEADSALQWQHVKSYSIRKFSFKCGGIDHNANMFTSHAVFKLCDPQHLH